MMSDELRARLLEAAKAGEVLRVAYHGGSQPGAAREIVPMVVGDVLVMADDCATDALRAFRIDLLVLLAPGAQAPAYEVGKQGAVEPEPTIPECFEPARDALVRLGWHVEIEPQSVTLHRFLKNGRPKKSPDVAL